MRIRLYGAQVSLGAQVPAYARADAQSGVIGGTFVGAPQFTDVGVRLDGVSFTLGQPLTTGDFTVSLLVRLGDGQGTLLSAGELSLALDPQLRAGGAATGFTPPRGRWVHLLLLRTGMQLRVYQDGVLRGSANVPESHEGALTLTGGVPTELALLTVYSGALSNQQLQFVEREVAARAQTLGIQR